jgi:ribosomal protein S18 acetylase RimI-like enzyme
VSSATQLQFREATVADEPQLLRMMRVLAEQEPGKIVFDAAAARSTFRRLLALPAFGTVWLLILNERAVGYIILTLGFSFEFRGHDSFVDELYVDPEYRRRGYGRLAVDFVERQAREMGAGALHLEVDHGNDPAIELYRRMGYQDHDRFLMTKWLAAEKQKSSPAS